MEELNAFLLLEIGSSRRKDSGLVGETCCRMRAFATSAVRWLSNSLASQLVLLPNRSNLPFKALQSQDSQILLTLISAGGKHKNAIGLAEASFTGLSNLVVVLCSQPMGSAIAL